MEKSRFAKTLCSYQWLTGWFENVIQSIGVDRKSPLPFLQYMKSFLLLCSGHFSHDVSHIQINWTSKYYACGYRWVMLLDPMKTRKKLFQLAKGGFQVRWQGGCFGMSWCLEKIGISLCWPDGIKKRHIGRDIFALEVKVNTNTIPHIRKHIITMQYIHCWPEH